LRVRNTGVTLRRVLASLVVAAGLVSACSDTPRLAPPPDRNPEVSEPRQPQVYASGTSLGGDGGTTRVEWDLEEIVGFSHAVSLTAATPTSITVRSASRQGASDTIWLVGTDLTPNGPSVVFGGADHQIDSIVLVNAAGDELAIELIEVPDLDWSLAIEELPRDWSSAGETTVEVVASKSGIELAREDLAGFNS
jgi:hypothetical protein